jgi:hypothetical protein
MDGTGASSRSARSLPNTLGTGTSSPLDQAASPGSVHTSNLSTNEHTQERAGSNLRGQARSRRTDPEDAAWSEGELVPVPSVFGRLWADLLLAPVPSMAEVKDRYGRPERGGGVNGSR